MYLKLEQLLKMLLVYILILSVLYFCVRVSEFVGSTFMIVNASLQMDTGNHAWLWEVSIDLLECSVLFPPCKLKSNLRSQISAAIFWPRLCDCGWHHMSWLR